MISPSRWIAVLAATAAALSVVTAAPMPSEEAQVAAAVDASDPLANWDPEDFNQLLRRGDDDAILHAVLGKRDPPPAPTIPQQQYVPANQQQRPGAGEPLQDPRIQGARIQDVSNEGQIDPQNRAPINGQPGGRLPADLPGEDPSAGQRTDPGLQQGQPRGLLSAANPVSKVSFMTTLAGHLRKTIATHSDALTAQKKYNTAAGNAEAAKNHFISGFLSGEHGNHNGAQVFDQNVRPHLDAHTAAWDEKDQAAQQAAQHRATLTGVHKTLSNSVTKILDRIHGTSLDNSARPVYEAPAVI